MSKAQPVTDCGKKLPDPFKPGKWSAETLQQVYDYVECQIERELDWYRRKKKKKASLSSLLRIVSIVFFAAGGLVPLVQASRISTIIASRLPANLAGVDFGQIGYLLIAIAASAIAFDRFSGSSTGWMRYITTMLALERAQMEFRLDWIRAGAALDGKTPSTGDVGQFLQIAKNVLVGVRAHIEQETQAWAAEFQGTLEQLESQLKTRAAEAQKQSDARAQSSQAGAISITVTNGAEADDGFDIVLDSEPPRRERGNSCQFVPVLPGDHVVKATAKIVGDDAFDSKVARVLPGAIVEVSLTLVKAKKVTP